MMHPTAIDESRQVKRQKRKESRSNDIMTNKNMADRLLIDAVALFKRLVYINNNNNNNHTSAATSSSSSAAAVDDDSKLLISQKNMSKDQVRKAMIKNLLLSMQQGSLETLCYDTLNNLDVEVKRYLSLYSREQKIAQIYHALGKLAVALWRSTLSCPYTTDEAKKSTDTYRPFVCGLALSLRRGLVFQNIQILPELESLGVRFVQKQDEKLLQSMSHRGKQVFQRCLSSVDETDQELFDYQTTTRLLQDANQLSLSIRSMVSSLNILKTS
jgi:hypothetical protein